MIVTGQVRIMQEQDRRRVRIEYEKKRWHPLWDHNPRIAAPGESGDFQILRPRTNGLRPYCSSKSEARWAWKPWAPPPGELYFVSHERALAKVNAGQVIIEPNVKKGASPNKQWPFENWKVLVAMMNRRGVVPVQLGLAGTRVVSGARLVETVAIRHAAAILSTARAVVTHEGALHHIAAALKRPAVVLFGGYISPAVTGYETQRNLFTGEGLGCGSRLPCGCCAEAMGKITPETVMSEFEKVIA